MKPEQTNLEFESETCSLIIQTYRWTGSQPALLIATYYGLEKVISDLLDNGADPNEKSADGYQVPPLLCAVFRNEVSAIPALTACRTIDTNYRWGSAPRNFTALERAVITLFLNAAFTLLVEVKDLDLTSSLASDCVAALSRATIVHIALQNDKNLDLASALLCYVHDFQIQREEQLKSDEFALSLAG